MLEKRQEAPHHKLPDTKASKQRRRQWIDTTVIQKSGSQKLPRKGETGDGCSRNRGVESKAKGGHERPGSIGEVPAGKSRETLGRERKVGLCHRPWPGEENGVCYPGWEKDNPHSEWEGSRYDDATYISDKSSGFLRCKLTNI